MNRHHWIVILGALALAGIVGGIAYDAGLAHGAEGAGKVAPHQPGWRHHHGGFFFFVPLFFLAVFLIARRGWCGPRHRHHLEEWHRRAHERMWNEGSSPGTPSTP